MFKVFNKQWKATFDIVHINEHNQAVDDLGLIHDLRALREATEQDEEITFTPIGAYS